MNIILKGFQIVKVGRLKFLANHQLVCSSDAVTTSNRPAVAISRTAHYCCSSNAVYFVYWLPSIVMCYDM